MGSICKLNNVEISENVMMRINSFNKISSFKKNKAETKQK